MLYDQISEAVTAIRAHIQQKPAVAIILGSGLGALATEIRHAVAIPYSEIPHFSRSTVVGHAGRLLIGTLEDVPVVAMQGRFHLYEGYSAEAITLPVRVMRMLGAETLIVSNAAGGVNPDYRTGDFMLLSDHINLPGMSGNNPLVGAQDERLGVRFPPLAHAYDKHLRTLAQTVAREIQGIKLHEGVYTMLVGPTYETSAELRFLRTIGTDAVGMSTVPEVVVARQMGMRVLGISLITNEATGNETQEVNHEEVMQAAEAARIKFAALVTGIVREIAS
ncbi:purine-nucleoside phosphorylase [Tengunoibacter tsumagoiensis]|uniref:Purine nucleoside phosphorylase n=1 Tax=Tengunoibacter tsumagoiensis TaxID=2014871 RepID=A0A402A325_9CHLR|nr:purine-nucleoside phosphorylase [Tengunoibacter tsumagoiensis]GCE13472.1 purine nucleoside phosphorylase 1 [Tengunoibacter tsumagoiensis]